MVKDRRRQMTRGLVGLNHVLLATAALLLPTVALMAQEPVPFLPGPVRVVSTVPPNGDVNPYGVAFVPRHFPAGGALGAGDVLVSNFNNSNNLQGTGTTIVQVPAAGTAPAVFFQGTAPLGLSTALEVLGEGLVVVGNFPSTDGTCGTATPGSLLVIDSGGNLLSTVQGSFINGPWDMTLNERGGGKVQLFVANALDGTIVRIDAQASATGLTVAKTTQVASGYMHRCDPAAFVVGPTGLVYDAGQDVLYVASTEDNAVFAVHGAGKTAHDLGRGKAIYRDVVHLHGPLGMAQAPNGDLLVANSDVINSDPKLPSEIVEFTPEGLFVKQVSMDPSQGGSFGLAVATGRNFAHLAAVDDVTSTLTIWTLPSH
jgi:hypothetical protein